jgi:hypothetical protein
LLKNIDLSSRKGDFPYDYWMRKYCMQPALIQMVLIYNSCTTPCQSQTDELIRILNFKLYRRNSSSRIRWVGHVALMGEKRNACKVLVGKPEGKRPLGRPRLR